MSAITLSSSHPTVTSKEDIQYSSPEEAYFTCDPPYKHLREWEAGPDGPERRGRTLVLCFDGTGDSFDEDVS